MLSYGKSYGRIWRHMAVFGSYGRIGPHMAAHGRTQLLGAGAAGKVFKGSLSDGKSPQLTVPTAGLTFRRMWPHMAVFGSIWAHKPAYCRIWPHMADWSQLEPDADSTAPLIFDCGDPCLHSCFLKYLRPQICQIRLVFTWARSDIISGT